MTQRGTVVASIPAGGARRAGNTNTASTSTDNTVTWDRVPALTGLTLTPVPTKTNDSSHRLGARPATPTATTSP